jgi:hypothetical protein
MSLDRQAPARSEGDTDAAAEADTGSRRIPKTGKSKDKPRRTRINSKQAQLIEMLKSPEGAAIEEIAKKFDWQPHTVRGAIAGVLKKKLGLEVMSEKGDGRGRIYRIID